ncbi:hypothetical protein CCACVL1_20206 [Corchorus capsularis]|uniref:Uncharacterized protein n=1 Tax=Corchorus capsularis TaxID=210143 RepID=A0A1R3HCI3_COCAP|nr:hypothetical protein CCACVL1_20206 [Corchorus capsularis]
MLESRDTRCEANPPTLGARPRDPARVPLAQLLAWNAGKPGISHLNQTRWFKPNVPSPYCPHLSHKLALPSSAINHRTCALYKEHIFLHTYDVGFGGNDFNQIHNSA